MNDIGRRVTAGNSVYGALSALRKRQGITKNTRLITMRCWLRPCYREVNNAVVMGSLRSIVGVTICDRISNEEICKRAGLKGTVVIRMK